MKIKSKTENLINLYFRRWQLSDQNDELKTNEVMKMNPVCISTGSCLYQWSKHWLQIVLYFYQSEPHKDS